MGQSKFGVSLTAIFCEVGRLVKPGWELSVADGPAKDSRTRWPRGRTVVLLTVVATALVRLVPSSGPLIVMAPSPTDHIMVALSLASTAKALVHREGSVGR